MSTCVTSWCSALSSHRWWLPSWLCWPHPGQLLQLSVMCSSSSLRLSPMPHAARQQHKQRQLASLLLLPMLCWPASSPPALLSLHLPRCSEDVLWSALFALAVVARDTSDKFVSHMLQLVRVGVLPALEHALAAYRQTMDDQVGCWLGRATRRTVGLNRRLQRACYHAAA